MSELKPDPCPFCDYPNVKITQKRSGTYRRTGDYVQVICNRCKARGPIFEAKYEVVVRGSCGTEYLGRNKEALQEAKRRAIEAWNMRTRWIF